MARRTLTLIKTLIEVNGKLEMVYILVGLEGPCYS